MSWTCFYILQTEAFHSKYLKKSQTKHAKTSNTKYAFDIDSEYLQVVLKWEYVHVRLKSFQVIGHRCRLLLFLWRCISSQLEDKTLMCFLLLLLQINTITMVITICWK